MNCFIENETKSNKMMEDEILSGIVITIVKEITNATKMTRKTTEEKGFRSNLTEVARVLVEPVALQRLISI